jgi:NADH-quinone oxidoreductase subunit A
LRHAHPAGGAGPGPEGGEAVTEFLPALLLIAVSVLLVSAAYAWSFLVRLAKGTLVSTPFMSGLEPVEHAVSRYHVRWYTITMVFLAFDMEMVFMYPWAVVVAQVGPKAVIEMFGFLAVLVAGVVYAWREGAFRWT